jgi:hypothetical protein
MRAQLKSVKRKREMLTVDIETRGVGDHAIATQLLAYATPRLPISIMIGNDLIHDLLEMPDASSMRRRKP